MALSTILKDTFTSIIPYLSLGTAVVMLEFFFEYLFAIVDGFLKLPLRSFMQRRLRKVFQVFPRFDSFITFLIALFIVAPLITILIRDILNPFFRSLTNNLFIMLITPLIILVIIYFAFEQWYTNRFRQF